VYKRLITHCCVSRLACSRLSGHIKPHSPDFEREINTTTTVMNLVSNTIMEYTRYSRVSHSRLWCYCNMSDTSVMVRVDWRHHCCCVRRLDHRLTVTAHAASHGLNCIPGLLLLLQPLKHDVCDAPQQQQQHRSAAVLQRQKAPRRQPSVCRSTLHRSAVRLHCHCVAVIIALATDMWWCCTDR